MDQKTTLRNIRIKSRAERLKLEMNSHLSELPERKTTFGEKWLQADRLTRNLAVVGALVLVVIALRNSTIPEAQSVFSVMQESAGMKWDENIGKLSFVNSLLPEEIQEVWGEQTDNADFLSLPEGDVVHTWAEEEPYLLIEKENETIFSVAEGEIMAIAHGIDEERIIRLKHNESYESIYGNLEHVFVRVGDYVEAGTRLGTLLDGEPLVFELRKNGSSMNPVK